MKKIISVILSWFISNLNKFNNHLNVNHSLQLVSTTYSHSGRFLVFNYHNKKLKDTRDVLFALYTSLMNDEKFLNFGFYKVIITSSVIYNQEHSYHHNILLTNNTTFETYYKSVCEYITKHYDDDNYGIEVIPSFRVKVWNMDSYKNKNITITKNPNKINPKILNQIRSFSSSAIKPITKVVVTGIIESFATIDIETLECGGFQFPGLISMAYIQDNQVIGKQFIIDHTLYLKDPQFAVISLWNDWYKFLLENNFKYIFAHNLGGFDGYYIYKMFSEICDPTLLKTIIDPHNKFINIVLTSKGGKVVFLDSYRIFSVSLIHKQEKIYVKHLVFLERLINIK